jgi:aspartate racemase
MLHDLDDNSGLPPYDVGMHKRIGILGGLTPESTVTYYQHIVHTYQRDHGNHGYPEIIIYSVSFQQFEDWMEAERWDVIAGALLDGLRRLAASGADFAVMATNTMHLLFDRLESDSPIPLISIVDATGRAIERAGFQTVGLLGTRFTMEKPFYAERLAHRRIATIVPQASDRQEIHRIIMEELSLGVLQDRSRQRYLDIISELVVRGAQGIVLGCTEIPLLVRPEHTSVPLFDTAVLHADEALNRAVGA